ncbi:hypothetical protein VIGAN_08064300, partial [Vigna angularis var. angularis]
LLLLYLTLPAPLLSVSLSLIRSIFDFWESSLPYLYHSYTFSLSSPTRLLYILFPTTHTIFFIIFFFSILISPPLISFSPHN